MENILAKIRIQLETVAILKEEEQQLRAYETLKKIRDIVNFAVNKNEDEKKFSEFFHMITHNVLSQDLNEADQPGIGMMRLQYIKILLGFLANPNDVGRKTTKTDGPLGDVSIYSVRLKK